MTHSVIHSLIEAHFQTLLDANIPAWLSLWDENGVFEFPYAPAGYPKQLVGIRAITDYMSGFPDKILIKRFDKREFFERSGGEEAVIEFTCDGEVLATKRPYRQHYISILKSKNGKLALYRDFWNPLIAIDAFGGADDFKDDFVNKAS